MKQFEILKEIAKCNPEGFTVEIVNFTPVVKGYVVAYLETQDSFNDEGLKRVIKHAKKHDKTVGGWLNEENGRFYYDSCKVFENEAEAIEFGKQNKQLAVFNLNDFRTIWL